MLIVLRLRHMVDEGTHTQEAFEQVGVSFETSARGAAPGAHLHYLMLSDQLAHYLRTTNGCEQRERDFLASCQVDQDTWESMVRDGRIDANGRITAPLESVSYLPGRIIVERAYHLPQQQEQASLLDPDSLYPIFSLTVNCGDDGPSSQELALRSSGTRPTTRGK